MAVIAALRVAFQPLREAPLLVLDLLADSTVSVDSGPAHGKWQKLDDKSLSLSFHYVERIPHTEADIKTIFKEFIMERIPHTEAYIKKGEWGAVLAPMHPPDGVCRGPFGLIYTTSNKRRRTC